MLGGDIRQILPVVKHGFRNTIVKETIKYSYFWPLFNIFNLKINIKSQNTNFASFLLKIEGKINQFTIPNKWKTNDVCQEVYKHINNNYLFFEKYNFKFAQCRSKYIKNKILNLIRSESVTYYSTDYATHKCVDQTDDNTHLNYQMEMLNNVRKGLPPHEIKLKVNAIVMLIRNLSRTDGL